MIRSFRNRKGGTDRTAVEEAVRLLARRPLTESELRSRLRQSGFDRSDAADAVRRMRDKGYLDDLELSRHFIVVRAGRKGHGRARLLKDLEKRGVDPATARTAMDEVISTGEFDPVETLAAQAEKRVKSQGGRLDRRGYARVYNALLRAGFEPDEIRGALGPFIGDREDAASRSDHEL